MTKKSFLHVIVFEVLTLSQALLKKHIFHNFKWSKFESSKTRIEPIKYKIKRTNNK